MSSRFLVVASLWLVFFVNGAVLSSWAPRQERVSTPPSASIREPHQESALGLHFYSKLLLAGGIIAIGAFLLKGMLTDWSALLLRRDFHADPALAASVLSMFSVAMFISRSISDTIMHHVRESTFLLFTAIIIALTIPATCATGSVPLVMAGIVVPVSSSDLCFRSPWRVAVAPRRSIWRRSQPRSASLVTPRTLGDRRSSDSLPNTPA